MNTIYSAFLTGSISFVATNIDDIFVLTALFSQSTLAKRQAGIVVGQYFGICALIIISIMGSLGALIIPKAWMGLLGIVPVYLGVKMFYTRGEEKPRYRNVLTDFSTYKVMLIVIGNGVDNIGVYTPVFLQGLWLYKSIVTAIFLVLTGVWCWIAFKTVHNQWMGRFIKRYGHSVIPAILIGLGGYIMLETGFFASLVKIAARL